MDRHAHGHRPWADSGAQLVCPLPRGPATSVPQDVPSRSRAHARAPRPPRVTDLRAGLRPHGPPIAGRHGTCAFPWNLRGAAPAIDRLFVRGRRPTRAEHARGDQGAGGPSADARAGHTQRHRRATPMNRPALIGTTSLSAAVSEPVPLCAIAALPGEPSKVARDAPSASRRCSDFSHEQQPRRRLSAVRVRPRRRTRDQGHHAGAAPAAARASGLS